MTIPSSEVWFERAVDDKLTVRSCSTPSEVLPAPQRPTVATVLHPPITDVNILQALADYWVPPAKQKSSVVPPFPRQRTLYQALAYTVLKDPRDLPIFNVAFLASLTVVPSGLNLLFGYSHWSLAVLHIALVIPQIERFVLALHVSSHKPAFRSPYSILNYWLPGLIAPFMGHTWGTYYWHHVKMHHVTDNGPDDLSSTLFYQRDSLLGFIHYFLNFYFCTGVQLANYFLKQGRLFPACFIALGEASWPLLVLSYVYLYPNPSMLGLVIVVLLPLNGMRFGMMQGNWVQHAFLERSDPLGGGMKNSITVIHDAYNINCFNDGYHASHHVNPIRHWTEHPTELVRDRQKYHDDEAIVFDGLNYAQVWYRLMTKDYADLARRWVHMGSEAQRPKNRAVIETLLREKTRRFKNMKEIESIYGNRHGDILASAPLNGY